ncbi:hypothetical protein PQQ72_24080 [Paraburkholderia strydomiana]|uniref:hypothetical protein n=1 Tax=Paraburkholderia strydomiana TaxID=1245417 RepID=UPI0038BD1F9C
MRWFKIVVLIFFISLAGCGGSGDTLTTPMPSTTATPDPAKIVVETDQDVKTEITLEATENSGLTLTKRATGESATYVGQRNPDGSFTSIDEVVYQKSGVKTRAVISDDSREFISESGLRFKISKSSTGVVVGEFQDPASGKSVITNLSTLNGNPSAAQAVSKASNGAAPASTIDKIPITVNTTQCGDVSSVGPVRVGVSAGTYSSTYPAANIGNGIYLAYIPNFSKKTAVNLETVKTILTGVKTIINTICGQNPTFLLATGTVACVASSSAMAASGVAAPLAAAWISLCENAVAASLVYCELTNLAKIPLPSGTTTGSDIPTGAGTAFSKVEDYFISKIPSDVNLATIQAYTDSVGAVSRSDTAEIPVNASAASLRLDDNFLKVSPISLVPSAPAARQPYVASADLTCMPAGASVISVVGSDGYRNSNQHTFTDSLTKKFTVTLTVPGAQNAGVQDNVSLTVTRVLGGLPPLTVSASLVFR